MTANRSASVPPAEVTRLAELFNARNFPMMEALAQSLLETYPDSGVLWNAYGIALRRQNKPALEAAQKAVDLLPQDGDVRLSLGNVLRDLGRLDEAETCYRLVLKTRPDLAEAHCNLGITLRELGRPEEAISESREALKIKPDFPIAYGNLGIALYELGQFDAALGSCRKALALEAEFAEVYNTVGNIRQDLGQLDLASAAYIKAIAINPDYAVAYKNLAKAQKRLGLLVEADACCRKALEIKPDMAEAIVFQADLLSETGDFDAAEILLKRAISINPDLVEAWADLPFLRKSTAADGAWLVKAEELFAREMPHRQELLLRYAAGKYYDDIGNYEMAFFNYHRANELTKRHGIKYDGSLQRALFDAMASACNPEWISRQIPQASDSTRPVFIVGMPRSGTSLAEQILASHPAVFGSGELRFWSIASGNLLSGAAGREMDGEALRRQANDYLRLLDSFSADALRVVDKMPGNYQCLGLIHAAFPHARIIHMRRDPVDTCLSIYFQRFETRHSYANDLDDLAHCYKEYRRIMAHWHEILPPDVILDVPYESLVDDQEAWSRKMVDFIGLPWDERCLNFHQNERTVSTASKWQVRQKINKSGVQRWRKYEKFIGPLLALHESTD